MSPRPPQPGPALLEWMGTGMFKTSVFPVPPGAQRKVTIQLTQLLRSRIAGRFSLPAVDRLHGAADSVLVDQRQPR